MAAFRGHTYERAMGPAFEPNSKKEDDMAIGIKRLKPGALAATALLGATLVWGGFAEAHHEQHELRGHLTTHQVDCDTLCTAGELTGDIHGKLEFTLSTLEDTPTPNVARYDGVNVITTKHGTFTGPDYGVWNLQTGQFTDYTEITSGTGIYAGAKGTMTIVGAFDPVSGTGSSEWRVVFADN
jgi:hypothetical protein